MPGTWSHIAYAAGKLTGIQSLIDYAMTIDAKADAEAAKNDPKDTQLRNQLSGQQQGNSEHKPVKPVE